jgi:hypothetical protein
MERRLYNGIATRASASSRADAYSFRFTSQMM